MPEESVMDLRMTLAKTLARANRPSLTNPGAILAEYESWLWAADALHRLNTGEHPMTTATEPPPIVPAIDVDELPALDQPDVACELLVPNLGIVDRWDVCPEVAVWRIRFHSGACDHGLSGSVLACDSCIRDLLHGSLSLLYCPGTCGMAVYIDGVMRL